MKYMIIVIHPKTCSQHSIVSGLCFFWDALYRVRCLQQQPVNMEMTIRRVCVCVCGGGGGGVFTYAYAYGTISFGVWSLLPEYFIHRLPENQVVLPKYYLLFCPKIAIWKILGGWSPPPPPSRLVRLWEFLVNSRRVNFCIPSTVATGE